MRFVLPSLFGATMMAGVFATSAAAQQVPVPSGLDVALFDVILDQEASLARFRFLAPEISVDDSGKSFADVVEDIQYLCDSVVLPSLAANDWTEGQIVISLSAQEVPFGQAASEVAQFFQPFTIQDGACQWEDF